MVTCSKREKVLSSEKSIVDVEIVEEDPDRELLVWAQEVARNVGNDSVSAVIKRMRIKAPEVVRTVFLS